MLAVADPRGGARDVRTRSKNSSFSCSFQKNWPNNSFRAFTSKTYTYFFSDNGKWKYRHGDSSWVTYFDWAFTFGFQELGSALDKRADATEAVRQVQKY